MTIDRFSNSPLTAAAHAPPRSASASRAFAARNHTHGYCFGGLTYLVCQSGDECTQLGPQSGCEFVSGTSGPTVCTLVCGPYGPSCPGGDECVYYGCRSTATCPGL